MPNFCVIEGTDGAGKSHLAAQLEMFLRAGYSTEHATIVARKDGSLPAITEHARERLLTMRGLAWDYPPDEAVWTYPRRYWLHTLAAWYELFHHEVVAPELARGATVIVDGWYFKHHARFRLSGDAGLTAEADAAFASLPQPNRILRLNTPIAVSANRLAGKSKPTEHGAFETQLAATHPDSLLAYQNHTDTVLTQLLERHPAHVVQIDDSFEIPQILELARTSVAAA